MNTPAPDAPKAPIWVAGVPPAPTGRTGRYERILAWPDIHCGDQDDRAVMLALQVTRHIKPQRIIQVGDAVDFVGLGRWEKDPAFFAGSVQRELDIQYALYDRIRQMAPRALRQQILGNHEERGVRLIRDNHALAGLRALSLESLMRLDELGWEPRVHSIIEVANGAFAFHHGTIIRNAAGYSARGELEKSHRSALTGHTHRFATYSHSSAGGELQHTEGGHLQNNPPRWRPERQNWQQGLHQVEVEVDGNAFEVTPIRFRRSYRTVINGREISA